MASHNRNRKHSRNQSRNQSHNQSQSQGPGSAPSEKKISYPYKVDYNDHFETPLVAYKDILPMLDAVAPKSIVDNDNDTSTTTSTQNMSTIKLSKKNKKKRRRKNDLNTNNDSSQDEFTSASTSSSSSSPSSSSSSQSIRSNHIIYDPYYCDGRTKRLLSTLGFTNVQHEKRDFYKDIKQKTIPKFHTLITNPPYSEHHKEKCMQFAIENLRQNDVDNDGADNNDNDDSSKPFFILMPNYVACRNHFRSSIMNDTTSMSTEKSHHQKQKKNYNNDNNGNRNDTNGKNNDIDNNDPLDIMYVIPSISYEYEHPEGTGKDLPPFSSIWFCGIPVHKVDAVKEAFRQTHGVDSVGAGTGTGTGTGIYRQQQRHPFDAKINTATSPPRLVTSLSELKELNAVPTAKRPNPKQRKKARMAKAKGSMMMMQNNNSYNISNSNSNEDNNSPKKSKGKGWRKRKRS